MADRSEELLCFSVVVGWLVFLLWLLWLVSSQEYLYNTNFRNLLICLQGRQ